MIIIIHFLTVGCKEKESNKLIQLKEDGGIYILNPLGEADKNVMFEFNKEGILINYAYVNDEGSKDGLFLQYTDGGILKKKSNWIKGIQSGEERTYDDEGNLIWLYYYKNDLKDSTMYEYEKDGKLKQHKIFKEGEPLYTGAYMENEKVLNIIHLDYLEEKLQEGVYTATYKFPILYSGKMEIYMRDTLDVETTSLDKYSYKVKINNAGGMQSYDIRFVYIPSENDTLVHSEWTYEHVVKLKNIE